MDNAGEFFFVVYRLAGDVDTHTEGDEFDTRREAIEHRNWFFGHSPGVVECWIEKNGIRTGAVLRRPEAEAARDRERVAHV